MTGFVGIPIGTGVYDLVGFSPEDVGLDRNRMLALGLSCA